MEAVTDFRLLDSKITADSDCSHKIKRRLLLGRKAMTNLDSILKSRDINLPTKVRLTKAMVFPLVMYGCNSGTIKKAERQRIDAFKLCFWRRFFHGGSEGNLQCGSSEGPGFDPWFRKIPWRWKWQPTPVLLPEKIP